MLLYTSILWPVPEDTFLAQWINKYNIQIKSISANLKNGINK